MPEIPAHTVNVIICDGEKKGVFSFTDLRLGDSDDVAIFHFSLFPPSDLLLYVFISSMLLPPKITVILPKELDRTLSSVLIRPVTLHSHTQKKSEPSHSMPVHMGIKLFCKVLIMPIVWILSFSVISMHLVCTLVRISIA